MDLLSVSRLFLGLAGILMAYASSFVAGHWRQPTTYKNHAESPIFDGYYADDQSLFQPSFATPRFFVDYDNNRNYGYRNRDNNRDQTWKYRQELDNSFSPQFHQRRQTEKQNAARQQYTSDVYSKPSKNANRDDVTTYKVEAEPVVSTTTIMDDTDNNARNSAEHEIHDELPKPPSSRSTRISLLAMAHNRRQQQEQPQHTRIPTSHRAKKPTSSKSHKSDNSLESEPLEYEQPVVDLYNDIQNTVDSRGNDKYDEIIKNYNNYNSNKYNTEEGNAIKPISNNKSHKTDRSREIESSKYDKPVAARYNSIENTDDNHRNDRYEEIVKNYNNYDNNNYNTDDGNVIKNDARVINSNILGDLEQIPAVPDYSTKTSDSNDDDDDDVVKTYGFISKGYGMDRHNRKKKTQNSVYGFDSRGNGYVNRPPGGYGNRGSEKAYGYSNSGFGSALRNGAKSKRAYSYETKGVGTDAKTSIVGGSSGNHLETDAKRKYGFVNKGYGAHANDGRKTVKSYGYSNQGYGFEAFPTATSNHLIYRKAPVSVPVYSVPYSHVSSNEFVDGRFDSVGVASSSYSSPAPAPSNLEAYINGLPLTNKPTVSIGDIPEPRTQLRGVAQKPLQQKLLPSVVAVASTIRAEPAQIRRRTSALSTKRGTVTAKPIIVANDSKNQTTPAVRRRNMKYFSRPRVLRMQTVKRSQRTLPQPRTLTPRKTYKIHAI